jgi:PhnB protein
METVMRENAQLQVSVMLAVEDALVALEWYKQALGAKELWNLGSVVGMEIDGAPIFLGQPANNGWETPTKLGAPSVRIEVFCDAPDAFIARALAAGADGKLDPIRNHQMPWGSHRQGSFTDPFGHKWFVGDRSPLTQHP